MANARKLTAFVHAGGQVFKPGDAPDKEYAERITNPKAWEQADAKSDAKP